MVDRAVPRRTYWVRLVRYDWNYLRAVPPMPKLVCSLCSRMSWSTVSNATVPVLQNLHGRQLPGCLITRADYGSFTLEPSNVQAVFWRKILFRGNGAEKLRFWGKWGSKPLILVSRPLKGTSLCGTASFDVFCVKIGARVSAVAFLKNPPK